MKEASCRETHGLIGLTGFCQRLAAHRSLLAALGVAATLGLFGGVRHAHAQCDPVSNGMTCMVTAGQAWENVERVAMGPVT